MFNYEREVFLVIPQCCLCLLRLGAVMLIKDHIQRVHICMYALSCAINSSRSGIARSYYELIFSIN